MTRFATSTLSTGAEWFEAWLKTAIRASDGIICILRSVAKDVLDYVARDKRLCERDLRIGFWHLGATFSETEAAATPEN